MRYLLLALALALSVIAGASLASTPSRGSQNPLNEQEARKLIARIVSIGSVTDRQHPERLRAAAELAALAPQPMPSEVNRIVAIMVEELVQIGAASSLQDEFRTDDVYPIVQVACRIDDVELFAALLPHMQLIAKEPAHSIASRIAERADLWRLGSSHAPGPVYENVHQGLVRDLLPLPSTDEGQSLFLRTAHGTIGFWTWLPWSDVPDDQVAELAVKFERLSYLRRRVHQLRDEQAASEARDLLVELAPEKSWLVGGLVLRAMYADYLYDPRVVALLEQHAEPFISGRAEGPKAFRRAHNLPLDKTTALSESRMID